MKLTDPIVKAAKPQEKPFTLSDGKGLALHVQPQGSKWWRFRYRFNGKPCLLSLGTYPDVTLKEARLERDRLKALIKQGINPSVQRQEDKFMAAKSLTNSFESVARDWWDSWQGTKTPAHATRIIRRLESDVFPLIGNRPLTDITAPLLLMMAKRIESRGALDIARRSLQTCSQIMRYAVAHGIAERNPAADIKASEALKPTKTKNNARIEARELPELMRKINGYQGHPLTRIALQLMAHTFVRTRELIEAQWDEFDLDAKEWRIPAKRMKMRTPHIIPLSSQVLTILQELKAITGSKSPMLFPSQQGRGKGMSNNTMLYALYRMGYKGRMTGHGFRGVASTVLHEMDFNHDHIELQLAHAPRNAVSAAYNHALYLKQRAAMMQHWSDYLDAQVNVPALSLEA
ncbi:tyrosine-type recombinase/integrase [Aquaspirillum soli]